VNLQGRWFFCWLIFFKTCCCISTKSFLTGLTSDWCGCTQKKGQKPFDAVKVNDETFEAYLSQRRNEKAKKSDQRLVDLALRNDRCVVRER
jgi:hypothetical protein